ncbi:hypothetical protein HOO65_050298 [Ceratocystis lukuohia]|uniref:Endonuclease/exonuclease/phosphatase domain-containing protein n=1 Tax=Ceratocystis lukuohia TaxID=2019550 RepID=A0ABR4MFZ7_9PEZI
MSQEQFDDLFDVALPSDRGDGKPSRPEGKGNNPKEPLLETTNSTAGVEAEEKETSPQAEPTTTGAHVEQPEKKETTKGKQAAKERKHSGPPTEKERNLAMAMKHIAEEKKQVEMKGKAISMVKGDADVRMLAGHVSAEFRAAFQKLQHRGHAPNPGQTEKKRQSPETGKATKPKWTTAQKQEAPSGKRTYATVAKQATGGIKQPVAQKKTTIKSPSKEGEQMVRVFIQGPTEGKEEAANRLEDFYVLGEEGPVPIRAEQWFSEQIAKQTRGQVKAIKRCRTSALPLCRTCWELHPTAGCREEMSYWYKNPGSDCPERQMGGPPQKLCLWAYSAPTGSIRPGEGLQELMRTEKDNAWITLGDLNAHHGTWDVNPMENEAGKILENWMTENDLTMLNDKEEPTHKYGRVIDLVIAPQATVGKWVTSMNIIPGSMSDHEIVEVKVRARAARKRPEAKWRLRKMNTNTFVAECKREADQLEKLLESNSDEVNKLELIAKELTAAVERALEASTPKTPSNIALKPWWNDACKEQNAQMRSARTAYRNQPVDVEKRTEYKKQKKAMRWEIVKAKKSLMSKIVVDLKEPKDVFRAVKWADDKTDRGIPLLQRPDQTKTICTAESVALLLETHTKEHTEKEWHFHEPNPEANEWSPLTSEEVKASL